MSKHEERMRIMKDTIQMLDDLNKKLNHQDRAESKTDSANFCDFFKGIANGDKDFTNG